MSAPRAAAGGLSALAPPPPPQIDPRALRADTVARASMALSGLGGLLVAGRALGLHAPACPFRTITGIACPGCGVTRLSASVVEGDLGEALVRDPAGVLFLAVLAVAAIASLGALVTKRARPPAWLGTRWVTAGLVGLLGAHWVTTLAWGGMLTT
jgi:hypothetical protein